MEVVWLSVGWVLVAVGIVGCVIPVVPGPILSYCGLLCLLGTSHSPTVAALVAFGVVTAVATVLDYVVPAFGAKKFNCSKPSPTVERTLNLILTFSSAVISTLTI